MLGTIEEVDELARAHTLAHEEHAAIRSGSAPPIPWAGGPHAGDARLRVLVPLLVGDESMLPAQPRSASWATLATHLPGRSGRQCRERWAQLAAQPRADRPAAAADQAVAEPAAVHDGASAAAAVHDGASAAAAAAAETAAAVAVEAEAAEAKPDAAAMELGARESGAVAEDAAARPMADSLAAVDADEAAEAEVAEAAQMVERAEAQAAAEAEGTELAAVAAEAAGATAAAAAATGSSPVEEASDEGADSSGSPATMREMMSEVEQLSHSPVESVGHMHAAELVSVEDEVAEAEAAVVAEAAAHLRLSHAVCEDDMVDGTPHCGDDT
jgi:hypothetical protein